MYYYIPKFHKVIKWSFYSLVIANDCQETTNLIMIELVTIIDNEFNPIFSIVFDVKNGKVVD